jgi:hypothetical protein
MSTTTSNLKLSKEAIKIANIARFSLIKMSSIVRLWRTRLLRIVP